MTYTLKIAGETLNQRKLGQWVAKCLKGAKETPNPAGFLQKQAEFAQAQFYALSDPGETPAHLVGLTVYDLAAARDELMSAVRGYARQAINQAREARNSTGEIK